jgi:hypothetical protein
MINKIIKSTVRLKEDLISNDIKEEPFDYEFIETQEVKHRKIVTENTVQLDTHSSTGEKSTVRLKEDLISDRFTSSHLNRITNSSVFVCSVCKISENSEESSSASFLCFTS